MSRRVVVCRLSGGWAAACFAATFIAAIASTSAAVGTAEGTASVMGTPTSCPVTPPNGKQPPEGENVFGRGPGGHGSDALWTNVWTWGEGVVDVPPDHVNADGSLGVMKWPWWRGVSGKLTITGHRLDGEATRLRADVPDGYGERGFIATGLTFPTTGCWEVTGRVGEASLTFVVRVRQLGADGAPRAAEVK